MTKRTKALFISVSIVYTISLVLFAISFSINLPIYFRPFYYMLIGPMKMVENLNMQTGGSFTTNDVIDAYNEVLNYCCFNTPFGTGKLLWSQEGMNHFHDCQGLFLLDTIVMFVSALLIGITHILKKKGVVKPFNGAHLVGGIVAIAIPSIVGILASIDFDKAFETFHHIFFPGKENWLFDQNKDQIIIVMPEEFFMACAIFIGVALLGISIYCIIRGSLALRKRKNP